MSLTLQKGIDPHTQDTIWLMLDEDYQIVQPIQRYLNLLCGTKSPNTVQSYGYGLKVWWEFLETKNLDWKEIQLADIEEFAYWMRVGDTSKVISLQPVKAIRSEGSINLAITAVTNFYEYHVAQKTLDPQTFDRNIIMRGNTRHTLLQGIAKSKPTRQKLVKLKETKKFPGCLTNEQVEALVNSCHRLRDKLIILLLNGTGIRKGELLNLRHEDMGDFDDYTIRIVKRKNNPNGARVKGRERVIPVSSELLKLYNDYLLYEYPEVESKYVIVNIWEGEIGKPMKPQVLNTMFSRLGNKVNVKVYPHLFRHTYATRLLRAGMPVDRVKYLMGHASVQTTLDTYSHVIEEADLRTVIKREEEE